MLIERIKLKKKEKWYSMFVPYFFGGRGFGCYFSFIHVFLFYFWILACQKYLRYLIKSRPISFKKLRYKMAIEMFGKLFVHVSIWLNIIISQLVKVSGL